MSRFAATVALAVAAGLPAGAGAIPDDIDEEEASDDEAGTELEPIAARGRLVGRSVVIEAKFELSATGPLPPPGASRSMSLPHDAVITGATIRSHGRSRKLALLETGDADKKLQALFDEPTENGDRRSAIRIDADPPGGARIEITVPDRTRVQLDVTLEVPTCFANDARHILLPATWEPAFAGGNSVVGEASELLDEVCGEAADGRSWIAFGANELTRRAAGAGRFGTYSARLPLGGSDIARIELALSRELTQIPTNLHTVLVVDHSRSVTTDELDVQRAVIAAYLRAAPHSRIQLVGYTRDARTLLPGWMVARHATTRVDRELRGLAPRNGSNVDRGLAAAATLLANNSGTRRVVIFTDDRLPDRVADAVDTYARDLPAGTLVNIVGLSGGFDQRLMRDDAHQLAPLARETGGVVMRADVDEHGRIDAVPLARPTSLDNVTITAPGWKPLWSGRECPDADHFTEGASCVWLAEGTPASGPVTVEGFLWGTKVTRVVEPDAHEARSLARLLTHDVGLPPELVEHVQRAAMAVNDAFSLVAMWGRGGYGDLPLYGSIGIGSIGTSVGHTITGIGHPITGVSMPTNELRDQLRHAIHGCKPRGAIVADIEITHEEIVDVAITPRNTRDSSLRDCIAERMWDTTLVLADPPSHATVRVEFQP